MEDWVYRALAKWPNVPAVFGWLGLDRRGRWRIRGELISRPQIIDTINRNYAADEHGRWYFQNGPQRGYMTLDYAPLVLRVDGTGALLTHTGATVTRIDAVSLDEDGTLTLLTEHGAGLLDDQDLQWALRHLRAEGVEPDEVQIARALMLPSGATTVLRWHADVTSHETMISVTRIDSAELPARFGFVRTPSADDTLQI